MLTSYRRFARIGTLVLLITVGLTVGMGPAMALSDTPSVSPQMMTEQAVIDNAVLEEA